MTAVDPDKTAAIIAAVLEELAEKGYGRTSMEAVARRAGVGKSALYRRWDSKQEMVVSLLAELSVPPSATFPDTGSLRGDLIHALDRFVDWLRDPRFATVLPDLAAEAARNPEFRQAHHQQITLPRRASAIPLFERAIERGELPSDTDVEMALDMISAPLYWHLNIRHEPIPPGYVGRLVDLVLRALTTSPAS